MTDRLRAPAIIPGLLILSVGCASAPRIVIDQTISLWAPGSDRLMSEGKPNIPIGWGYMDPMVISCGPDFYAPVFYPRDSVNRGIYCIRIYKNGIESITADELVL